MAQPIFTVYMTNLDIFDVSLIQMYPTFFNLSVKSAGLWTCLVTEYIILVNVY